MSSRRDSPPIPEDNSASARSPSLTRSRASSGSLASVSSITSLNGLLSSPSTATATASTAGSSTAVLANGHVTGSSNSLNGLNGGTIPTASSSIYYPAFPIRNKSRTPSVSSTSTITQPVHSLLQTSGGILPKRHAALVSAAPTLSTASATASLSLASPALSTTSSPTGSIKYTNMAGGSLSNSNSATSIDSSAANGRSTASNPTLVLEPVNNGFATKSLDLPENTHVKIGRQTGVTTAPSAANGYFDSKVLSRIHAEVWSENSKVFIKDLKSSNGTFLNGKRLSPENVESEPFELNQNDHLEFGIDIMDDSGSMLHEKVACKVYYFTMSYPTPGGSPQEAHARLKSSSPTEPGSNSRPASVTGQGTNIDLIISRLQSELTRSQETNADLGALKQGLGELERTITVSAKEEGKQSGSKGSDAVVQATQAVEYQRLLVENNQAYATEIARLTRMLEDTQAEMNAYVQKIQLLEPLVADDEILRRDIAQNSAELTKVKLERDLAKDSMNELITEHQQVMESLRKEQETALAVLEVTHKESLECVARETALAQELLMSKHQEDLEKAIQSIAVPEVDSANAEEAASLQLDVSSLQLDVSSLQLNVSSLTTEVGILQQTVEKQIEEIKELSSEKVVLTRELSETKAVVVKAEKELKEAKQRTTQENIVALTPTSPTIKAEGVICKECLGRAATTTTATSVTSTRDSKDTVARYEFSWAQFVFPMSKKGQPLPFHQPTTALMSGGFMLVGIGAYVFWNKGVRP